MSRTSVWCATRTAVDGASTANAASLSVIHTICPRERYYGRRGYEDRGGVGFVAPGVSVGIGTGRY